MRYGLKFFKIVYYILSSNIIVTTPGTADEAYDDQTAMREAAIAVLNSDTPLTASERLSVATVAADFATATQALQAVKTESRIINPWVTKLFYFQQETYLSALQNSKDKGTDFAPAYTAAFTDFLDHFDPQYVNYVPEYFERGLPPLENRYWRALATFRNAPPADKLTTGKAAVLAWYSWVQLRDTRAAAQGLLADYEARHLRILKGIRIPVADGQHLEATVYLPAKQEGPLPAVLVYNLYAKGWNIDNKAIEAAMRGYAGVLVYPRGKGASSGEAKPFQTEYKDGFEIIDWISKQPWNDGQVGMLGGSYLGFAQWAVTKKLHPALKTIVPSTAVVPGYNDNLSENGILNVGAPSWFHLVTNTDTMDFGTYYDGKWGDAYRRYYEEGQPFNALESLYGKTNAQYAWWLKHQRKPETWQAFIPTSDDFAKIDIPVLATTGYFDHAQLGSLYYLTQHLANNPDARHFMLIGPWDHLGANSMPRPNVMSYQIDPVAHININGVIFDWFDHILKGADRPGVIKDRFNYQLMGKNEWRHASRFDQLGTAPLTFYLDIATEGGLLSLTPTVGKAEGTIDLTVDLSDRTGASLALTEIITPDGLNPGDALIFESAPFEQAHIFAGQLAGSLIFSVNRKDVDIMVVLYEKKADGSLFRLSHFKARASQPTPFAKRTLLVPGEKTALPVRWSHFSARSLASGSRLVLAVGVNRNPRDQLNYGTGGNVASESMADAGTPVTLRINPGSRVEVPMLVN